MEITSATQYFNKKKEHSTGAIFAAAEINIK